MKCPKCKGPVESLWQQSISGICGKCRALPVVVSMPVVEHTPGPWTLTSDGRQVFPNATGYGSQSVALVSEILSPTSGEWETQANARLIATAPNMLKELKYALDVLESEGFGYDVTQSISEIIAKAEGRNQS